MTIFHGSLLFLMMTYEANISEIFTKADGSYGIIHIYILRIVQSSFSLPCKKTNQLQYWISASISMLIGKVTKWSIIREWILNSENKNENMPHDNFSKLGFAALLACPTQSWAITHDIYPGLTKVDPFGGLLTYCNSIQAEFV